MGAYTLLQDLTVTTNSTSVVLNDFGTITKDDFVKVVVTFTNVGGSDNVQIFANTATTATNYHYQVLGGYGTVVEAFRVNDSRLLSTSGSSSSAAIAYIKLSENDRFNCFSNFNFTIGSTLRNFFAYTTSSGATFTSGITSLTFTSSATNAIGTGSRIQIYKLAATKVADITVATNTTQVDISSLSIDKDSEYLLVSNSPTGNIQELFVNDNTTSTNYHTQRIGGNGTSTFAQRLNTAWFTQVDAGASLAYTFIKLSNIGAYTAQSYNIVRLGSSGIFLNNFFTSSTAENITNITKLNIKAITTNGIGAGSRFTLYKLYE